MIPNGVSVDPMNRSQGILLNNSLYTKIFKYFIDKRDFETLLKILYRIPARATNADNVLKLILPLLKEKQYKTDELILKSLFHLYKLKFDYESAFYTILKMRDIQIFDFLDEYKVAFPINPNLGKLLRIDRVKSASYMLSRQRGSAQEANIIIKNCVQDLSRLNERLSSKKQKEADYNTHLFLDGLFTFDKEISRPYHEQQIQLYIDFDKDKLMNFLQETDSFAPMKAIEMCKNAGMYKE